MAIASSMTRIDAANAGSMEPSSYPRRLRRFAALLIVPISLLLLLVANAPTSTTFLDTADARVEQPDHSSWEKPTIPWVNVPLVTSTPVAVAPQLLTTAADPTAPSAATATAGDKEVALTWRPSNGRLGVAGYRIYRSGSLVAETSATSTAYTETRLANGTSYSYYVVAYDSRGRVSPPSATVWATPTAPYYVAASGSDSNPGTSSEPWRTFRRATGVADAGSTVIVRDGTYAEDVVVRTSGTPSSPITFRADSGAAVSLRSLTFAANHIVFSGITISGASGDCVTLRPALTGITVRDGRVTRCGRDGIRFTRPTTDMYTRNVAIESMAISRVGLSTSAGNNLTIYGNNVTVLDSDLTDTPNDAINAWGDSITIRRNVIHDIANSKGNHNDAFQTWTGMNDGAKGAPVTKLVFAENTVRNISGRHAHAIMSEGSGHSDWRIYGNVIENIGDQAFVFGRSDEAGVAQVNVYNNTFVRAGAHNTMEFNGQTSGRLANNIFYDCVGWADSVPYWLDRAATVARDHNLAGGTTKPLKEIGAVNSDPAFVDSASDFHLTASSPGIDAGDSGLARAVDRDGKPPSGIVDIGAYEYSPAVIP